MYHCPNKNLPEWGRLVALRGENTAYYLWDKYAGEVPETEFIENPLDAVTTLKKSGFFETAGDELRIKKNWWHPGMKMVGELNRKYPGFASTYPKLYKGKQYTFVKFNEQMSLFQKTAKTAEEPIKRLDALLKDYMQRAGFTVVEQERVLTRAGNEAIAHTEVVKTKDGFVRLVRVAKGKAKADTLSEEAAHIAVELAEDNPLTQRLISLIHETPYYEEVKKEYGEEVEYQDDYAIRKEAAGKLIAAHLVKQGKEIKPLIQRLVDAIWKWLTGKLNKVDENALLTEWDIIAKDFASNIISGANVSTINKEMSAYQAAFNAEDADWIDLNLFEGDYVVRKKSIPLAVEAYIKSAKNVKALLERQLVEKHATENAKIRAQIEKIEDRLQTLKEVRIGVFDKLQEFAEEDVKYVSKSLKEFDTLQDKPRFFHIAAQMLNAWAGLDTLIHSGDPTADAIVSAISSSARNISVDMLQIYKEYVKKQAVGFTDANLFEAIADTSGWVANGLYIGNFDIPEFRYVASITEREAYFAEQRHAATVEELKNKRKAWEETLAKRGMSKKDGINLFLQKNSKGELTGNLLGLYKQAFYEEKQRRYKEAQGTNRWRAYYRWLEANTDVVVDEAKWEIAQENAKAEYTLPDGTLDEAAYNKWFAIHDPWNSKEYSKMKEYVAFEPNVDLWEDPVYTKLKNDPEMFAHYNYIVEFLKSRRAMMPYARLPYTYLPEMAAGTDMLQLGTAGMLKALGTGLRDYFTVEVAPDYHNDPVDASGQRIKGIPIHMLNNVLSPQEKELDFWKVMEHFDGVAQIYEYRRIAEPMVLLVRDIFRTVPELVLGPDGTPMTANVSGGKHELSNGHKNALAALTHYMDAMFYEEGKEALDQIWKVGVKKDENGKIIDHGRGISVAKFADILAAWTRRKAMGLNVFAGAVNAIFGLQTLLTHASGGQDFKTPHVYKAFKICLALGAPGTPLYSKLDYISRKYNLLPDVNDIMKKDKIGADKVIFFFNEQTEKFNRLMTAVSRMLAIEVEINGKKMNLFEAHGLDGKTEVAGYESLSNGAYKFTSAINALNDKLYGDYRNPKMYQANVVKRFAAIFRTWLFEAVEARIGTEKQDERLLNEDGSFRTVKGRLRTFAQALADPSKVANTETSRKDIFASFTQEFFKQLANSFMLGNQIVKTETFKTLKEIDKVNMIKNVAMLRMTLMVYVMGLLLAGAASDDDEERSRLLLFALTNTYRLQGDMVFFLHPGQLTYMSQNVFPAASTLTDTFKFFGAVPRAIMGNDEIEGGPYDGQSYLWRRFLQALPVSSQAVKWVDLKTMNIEPQSRW